MNRLNRNTLGLFMAGVIAVICLAIVDQTAAQTPTSTPEPACKPVRVYANDGDTGEVIVNWQHTNSNCSPPVYRVGWVNHADYRNIIDQGRNWLDAFNFVEIAMPSNLSYTVKNLAPGDSYYFIVASLDKRFGDDTVYSDWISYEPHNPSPPPPDLPTCWSNESAPSTDYAICKGNGYRIDEAERFYMRLENISGHASTRYVAVFTEGGGRSSLRLTQNGKVIHESPQQDTPQGIPEPLSCLWFTVTDLYPTDRKRGETHNAITMDITSDVAWQLVILPAANCQPAQ